MLFVIGFILSVKCGFSQHLTDGPYVFYHKGKTEIYSVNADFVQRDSNQKKIYVSVTGQPSFEVKLKAKIEAPPVEYAQPKTLLVVSDIEGEFAMFRDLLLGNKVMDEQYHWTFGKGHLVICGDLFDRGKDVTAYLWLLYRLEDKASAVGGYVHVILGNHDIMNMGGDYRYVDQKYFASAKAMGREYSELYKEDTELGRWLRSKNTVEKIGDGLYLHGGVSPYVNSLGFNLAQLNMLSRGGYGTPQRALPAELRKLYGSDGLWWYRGYFEEPRTGMATVDSTLQLYGVKRIVVGHTITDANISYYYDRKVLGVDVDAHEGKRAAALYDKGSWWLVDNKGNRKPIELTTKAFKVL